MFLEVCLAVGPEGGWGSGGRVLGKSERERREESLFGVCGWGAGRGGFMGGWVCGGGGGIMRRRLSIIGDIVASMKASDNEKWDWHQHDVHTVGVEFHGADVIHKGPQSSIPQPSP